VEAYVGLVAGVNSTGITGGASVAMQNHGAGIANITSHMTGSGGSGIQSASLSGSTNAFANLHDNPNTWAPGFGIWIAPLYSHARGRNLDVSGVRGGYRTNMGGGTLGFDYTTNDGSFRVGLAGNLGTGRSRSTGEWLSGKNNFNYGGVNLYGGLQRNNFTVLANIGWSRNANRVSSPIFDRVRYNTDVWSFGTSAEYTFTAGEVNIIPGLGLEYSNVRQAAFTLRYLNDDVFASQRGRADVWNLPVSLRINRGFSLSNGVLTPELAASWIPSLKDRGISYNTRILDNTTAGGMMVTANSPMLDRHTGAIGPSLTFDTAKYTVGAEYQYRFSSHYRSHSVGATFRLKF
jgi:hypothetical protein